MANFYETYNGDILSLNYIQPTVEAKSIFIAGLTTAFDVSVNGQTAYYYTSETFDISDGEAGRKIDLSLTGGKRHSFDLEKSYGIGGIVPLVGHATVSEDVIGRKLVDSAAGVIAADNKKGLTVMISGDADGKKGKAKTYTASEAGAYADVIDAVRVFNEANAVKFEDVAGEKAEGTTTRQKAKGGWVATTLIVGPAFYAKLQKCEEFSKWAPGQTQFSVNEAVVGRVGGLDVVYTTALTENDAEFIVMNPNGFLAPKGVSATEVFDKVEGRPGAILAQSEMVYGYKVLDEEQIHVYKKSA